MDGNRFGEELMTLVDEEGNEHEFELLDIINSKDGTFYALTPAFDGEQDYDCEENTYYIFESVEENGEEQLAEVENDELLDRLAVIFESRFEKSYEDNSEDF